MTPHPVNEHLFASDIQKIHTRILRLEELIHCIEEHRNTSLETIEKKFSRNVMNRFRVKIIEPIGMKCYKGVLNILLNLKIRLLFYHNYLGFLLIYNKILLFILTRDHSRMMKKEHSILTILIITCLLLMSIGVFLPVSGERPGSLNISSPSFQFNGSKVFIDGVSLGTLSVTQQFDNISVGTHQIKINETLWGHEEWEFPVEIKSGATSIIFIPAVRGSKLFIDGVYLGTISDIKKFDNITGGTHQINITNTNEEIGEWGFPVEITTEITSLVIILPLNSRSHIFRMISFRALDFLPLTQPAISTNLGIITWILTLPSTFLVVSLIVILVCFTGFRKYNQRIIFQKPNSEVFFSVISPKTVAPESSFLIDIWAHLEDQRNEVINRSKDGSIDDNVLIKTKGPTTISKGSNLVIHLNLPDVIIENSDQHLLWKGNISSANFLIKVPKDVLKGVKIGTVKIYAEGLLILNFFFEINIAEKMTSKEPIYIDLHRISKAFVSYASPDREKVLSRIQGIQKIAPYLEFKMDIKDIKSGQKWKESIRKFIETSDIFYLFWSKNAKDSPWVEKEWKCALKLKGIDFIDPIPLESPEDVPPPIELAEKHFNDWTLAYSRMKI
jgi:hypothetical protein